MIEHHSAELSRPAYEVDPYLRRLETELLSLGTDERGVYAVLADTILYPEGGGQPADHGTLVPGAGAAPPGGALWRVVDVRRVGGETRHYLNGGGEPAGQPTLSMTASGQEANGTETPSPGPIVLELDWARRYDHMQQHSAQHLLSAVAEDEYHWPTTSFHLGAEVSDVELDVPALQDAQIVALEDQLAIHVRAGRPLLQSYVNIEAGVPGGVRSRGLPDGHSGPLRLIEIEGVDVCACGGTHLRSTAEMEAVKLLHSEPMRGGTRLYFVAGARTRRRLGAGEERLRELRGVLGVPESELADAARARIEQSTSLARALQARELALSEAHARRLAALAEPVAGDSLDTALVALVAQAATRLDGRGLVLVAADSESGPFALGAGMQCTADVQKAGGLVAGVLDGRGGGSGRLYTGRADRLHKLPEALDLLRHAVAETPS